MNGVGLRRRLVVSGHGLEASEMQAGESRLRQRAAELQAEAAAIRCEP